jgi:hypothetical protein
MFLTRLGENSRMVVTGDPSQVDLDLHQRSGLADAMLRLQGFANVGVVEFGREDICRHPLVDQIVKAYEAPLRTPPAERASADGDGPTRTERAGHGRLAGPPRLATTAQLISAAEAALAHGGRSGSSWASCSSTMRRCARCTSAGWGTVADRRVDLRLG